MSQSVDQLLYCSPPCVLSHRGITNRNCVAPLVSMAHTSQVRDKSFSAATDQSQNLCPSTPLGCLYLLHTTAPVAAPYTQARNAQAVYFLRAWGLTHNLVARLLIL